MKVTKHAPFQKRGVTNKSVSVLGVSTGRVHDLVLAWGGRLSKGFRQVRTASKEFRQKVQRMTRRRSLLVTGASRRGDRLLNDAVSFGARGS